MKDLNLKPCPFCGGTDFLVETYLLGDKYRTGIVCRSCLGGIDTKESYLTSDEARSKTEEAWNKRVTPWIPVSERLPEKEVDVLCCRDNKTMDIMHFNPVLTTRYPKGFSVVEDAFSWRQDNVIAWTLPEPYKGVDA